MELKFLFPCFYADKSNLDSHKIWSFSSVWPTVKLFSPFSTSFYLLCATLPTVPLRPQAGAEVLYNRHVTHIYRKDAGWEVCHKEGATERFDIVVLTMPVPQILQLQGDVGSCEFIVTPQTLPHTLVFLYQLVCFCKEHCQPCKYLSLSCMKSIWNHKFFFNFFLASEV